MSNVRVLRFVFCVFFVCIFCGLAFGVPRKGWNRKDVDIRAGNGRRIRGVYYPEGKEVFTRAERKGRLKKRRLAAFSQDTEPESFVISSSSSSGVLVNTIESPPIDGFIPWIVVTATDERQDADDMVFDATKESSVQGSYLPDDPLRDYAIGLFDTGASAHVMGYGASQVLNVTGSRLTGNYIEISGVTGSVLAWVSEPLGLFIAGLGSLDPVEMTLGASALVGESNVSIVVGDEPWPGDPDLPTAIGSPMSVFYTTVFRNDSEITIDYGGEEYTAPDISVYEHEDTNIPDYSIIVPLELRPGGAVSVSYIPTLDFFNMVPSSPSIIIGNSSQSLFFVHAVDMVEDGNMAFDKDRFMLDTGAQVTVIGSRIAARLGIDPDWPEFMVDIEGVTGDVSEVNGYYIDSVEIPALGEWLRFTNVPVILLDIASPEGGTLDGIIGMNLFNEYNMVLRGGGMFLEDDPMLELELIVVERNVADIWPDGGDGLINLHDFSVCAEEWLLGAGSDCDIAPIGDVDGEVDILDLAVLAENWMG